MARLNKPRHSDRAEPTATDPSVTEPAATEPAAARPDADAGMPDDVIRAVPVRHPGRWAAALAVAVLAAMGVNSLVRNDRFQWDVVGEYLFAEQVLRGLWATVYLTVLAMAIGIVGGVALAVLRMSPNPLLAGAARLYIWFFRGTPVLVQLLFWSFLGALYPNLSLGIPFGPEFVSIETNSAISLFTAALLGLGLNEAAYMAEIIRAGIDAVDEGQTEAAHALGMSRMLTLRRIVLPQAMRTIIPPTGNETISMLKTTSLVSVIGFTELLNAVQLVYARNYRTIPLLIVAAVWYLVLTSVLSIGQHLLERRYSRGTARGNGRRRGRARIARAGSDDKGSEGKSSKGKRSDGDGAGLGDGIS